MEGGVGLGSKQQLLSSQNGSQETVVVGTATNKQRLEGYRFKGRILGARMSSRDNQCLLNRPPVSLAVMRNA